MNLKTDHEFNAQVDVLLQASSKSPDRLNKLGDLKAKWRAAKGNDVELSTLADELDAIAVQVRDEQKSAAAPKPAPAPTPTPAPEPTTTPAPSFAPAPPHPSPSPADTHG
jgi:hypothetical protein